MVRRLDFDRFQDLWETSHLTDCLSFQGASHGQGCQVCGSVIE